MNLPARDKDFPKLVAPEGGVTGGTPVLIGSLLVVPEADADAGDYFTGQSSGHLLLPKAAETVSAGDLAYWDDENAVFTKTNSGALPLAGIFTEDAASDADAWVLFHPAFKSFTGGDITGVTAGTGLTGGGSSGGVSLAVDFGTSGSKAVSAADLASTAEGKGAALIGLEAGSTGEGGPTTAQEMAEATTAFIDSLAATTEGDGAARVGVETILHGSGATVQAQLEDLVARVYALENP